MIKQYGSRWNHDERAMAVDDMNVMAPMPTFIFGYIEERKEGLRVVSFFDVAGNKEHPIRGQEIIDNWTLAIRRSEK